MHSPLLLGSPACAIHVPHDSSPRDELPDNAPYSQPLPLDRAVCYRTHSGSQSFAKAGRFSSRSTYRQMPLLALPPAPALQTCSKARCCPRCSKSAMLDGRVDILNLSTELPGHADTLPCWSSQLIPLHGRKGPLVTCRRWPGSLTSASSGRRAGAGKGDCFGNGMFIQMPLRCP